MRRLILILVLVCLCVGSGSAQIFNWTQTTEADFRGGWTHNTSHDHDSHNVTIRVNHSDAQAIWFFEENNGTLAYSYTTNTSNENTGTLTAAAMWTTGKIGHGLTFVAASSQKVSLPADSYINIHSPVSIVAWVKTTAAALQAVFDNYNGGAGSMLAMNADGTVTFYRGGGTDSKSTSTINDGEWHLVVGTYDGADKRIYVDLGAAEDTDGGAANNPLSDESWIGGRKLTGAWYWDDEIDEVRIYNRALSQDEIEAIYNGRYEWTGEYRSAIFDAGDTSSITDLYVNGTYECASCNITAYLNYSDDQVTWSNTSNYTISTNGSQHNSLSVLGRYMRVNFSLNSDERNFSSVLHDFTVTYGSQADFLNETPANNSGANPINVSLGGRFVNYDYDEYANITYYFLNGNNHSALGVDYNVTNNTTSSVAWNNLSYAVRYCWFVNMNNSNISVNSSVFCFTTTGGITVYEENDPTSVIGSDISVVFTNDTDIWENTTVGGILNLSGLPTNEEILLTFQDTASYYARNILLPNGFDETDRVYVLSKGTDAVTVTFTITDYTGGDFSGADTRILLRRWLNGSERYVAGGYRGVGNSFGAILQLGATYNVYVANDLETRALGLYYAQQSGTVELEVGYLEYPLEVFASGEWVAIAISNEIDRYANGTLSDAWVLVSYNDTRNATSWVNITILNYSNQSVVYATNATTGTSLVSFTFHFNVSNTSILTDTYQILLNFSSDGSVLYRSYLFDFKMVELIEEDLAEEFDVPQGYLMILGLFMLGFVAMIFSFGFADIGGFVLAFMIGMLWVFGFFPDANLGLGVLLLAFIIAAVNAVYVKKVKREI